MNYNFFNFKYMNGQFLLTNDMGRYIFLQPNDFHELIGKRIDPESEIGLELKDKAFLVDDALEYIQKSAYSLRESKGFLANATSLHIFVVTTACNLKCVYCQANNDTAHDNRMMTKEIAKRAVDIALQSPARHLSFEFQGGEPLLNFPVIRYIVEYADSKKGNHLIDYSLVSNLALLTDDITEFISQHNITVSASIDGPDHVHDWNRPSMDGSSSYAKVIQSVGRLREANIHVGAIETTTKRSLKHAKEIVHTYAEHGFDGIFLRPLTPLGRAGNDWERIGYSPEEFLAFYEEALNECKSLNIAGQYFREDHASILMKRILGKNVNYMELRSPCGASIGQLAYYADGNIFTCDEARMVYEMGSDAFRLGNVWESDYKDLISNSICQTVCKASILESIPGCTDCVYQPYCGTCPVVSFARTGDIIEKQPRNYRCRIYMGILDILFTDLQSNDETILSIYRRWSN